MVEFAQCRSCSVRILKLTADKYRGRCVPCARRREDLLRMPMRILHGLMKLPRDLARIPLDAFRAHRRKAQVPRTRASALQILVARTSAHEVLDFATPDDFACAQHFGLGLWIRNSLGLWAGNEALLADCGDEDPDIASWDLLCDVWREHHRQASQNERSK